MGRADAETGQGEGNRQRSRRRAAALTVYFDTSAFVKLVIDEPGTSDSVTIWRSAERRISSRLLYPEARAALAAARRTGRLDRPGLEHARTSLERLWSVVSGLDVSEEIARRAGDLADDLSLRGYDAVHLATAETVVDDDGLFASTDAQLAAAARILGLPVARLA